MNAAKLLEQEIKETEEMKEGTESVSQQVRNQTAHRLLQQWLSDELGYDEEVWPVVKQTIEENRTSDHGADTRGGPR